MSSSRPIFATPLALILAAAPLFAATPQSPFRDAADQDPVEWASYSKAAVAQSRERNLPLFFFVGNFGNSLARAMQNETFANKTIAELLNETSVPILVDAHQEPELAAELTLIAANHFGVNEPPVCLWTTHELEPLNGGGYFPPTDDWGSQGFLTLARNVAEQWKTNPEELRAQATERLSHSRQTTAIADPNAYLREAIDAANQPPADAPALEAAELALLAESLALLPQAEADELAESLEKRIAPILANAGFDPISGGFFIGSNDPDWKLPLFQKSASEQALMLGALAKLYERDPKNEYADAIRLTTTFIRDSLLKPNGLSRQSLDSYAVGESFDTVEGSYYLFEASDLQKLPAETLEPWGLNPSGNLSQEVDLLGLYTGQNIAFSKKPDSLSSDLDDVRAILANVRARKSPPASEEIGYTSTNALLTRGLTTASQATRDASYLALAVTLYDNIMSNCASNGELATLYDSDLRQARASSPAYANLIAASIDLFEATGEKHFQDNAKSILALWRADSRFPHPNPLLLQTDPELSTFSQYSDHAIPSAASVHLKNLNWFAKQLNDAESEAEFDTVATQVPQLATSQPQRFTGLATALAEAQR